VFRGFAYDKPYLNFQTVDDRLIHVNNARLERFLEFSCGLNAALSLWPIGAARKQRRGRLHSNSISTAMARRKTAEIKDKGCAW
jgi:hypothetical protein